MQRDLSGNVHQNAQLIDTDFSSFKVLAAQMSSSLADRAVGISTFSMAIL